MKKYIQITTLVCIVVFLFSGLAFSQEEDEPVYPPFETLTLIDNETTYSLYKGSKVLEIQHRFSDIEKINDIFGIFGSANTRIGFTYGISDKIALGLGTTRAYMQQDLNWKYAILRQTTSGRMPISLSYYGNAVLDAREDKYFGPEEDYQFAYRMSYLTQLLISRKFGEKVGISVNPTFVYYNAVPEGYRNDNYSLNFGGRFQVLGFHAIIIEYDQPLVQPTGENAKTIEPNLSFGVEIGTSTHSFRVFASNYNSIVKNRDVAFNDRSPWEGDYQFGFNISIRF